MVRTLGYLAFSPHAVEAAMIGFSSTIPLQYAPMANRVTLPQFRCCSPFL